MTPPLVMNWKMLMNLVASIGTPMKKEAMDTCFLLTVLTISGEEVSGDRRYFNSSLSRYPFLRWEKNV